MAWVVEMTGYDPVAAQEKTVAFAMGVGIPATDRAYIEGGLMSWSTPSQSIDIGSNGMVSTGTEAGQMSLANAPDDINQAAPLDAYADWVWQDRVASIYRLPALVWADKELITSAVMKQPVVGIGNRGASKLTFQLRDPRSTLETPLQPTKFAGTNVGPAGVEGGDDLKGKPKPIIYGLVSNISPPIVNQSLLIYQLTDKLATVLCVRDGGAPLALGVVRASLATLQSTTPAPGKYDVFRSATGTYIRLGSTPIFGITCDADEATSVANQSHAKIWSRIRTERVGSTVDAASVTAADAIDAAGAGFYWDGEVTQKAALDTVLGSFSGYEIQQLSGAWAVAKLVIPSGTPVIELQMKTPTVRKKATTRFLRDMVRVRPSYAPDGAPPFRVNVLWGRNHTVMSLADFAGAVGQRLREKFSSEFRTAVATNTSIWNPDTKTGPWKNAPEMTIQTGYQPGADGRSDAAAAAEAARILALLGPLRGSYQLGFIPEAGSLVMPGAVVRITFPRFGMETGSLFRVLQVGYSVAEGVETADLVVGLQV